MDPIYQEAKIYHKSSHTTLTEKHFAIKRYFHPIVRRVEQTFRNAHNDAKDWLKTILDPLTAQIHKHSSVLSQQLSGLKLTGHSRTTVRHRLAGLKKDTTQQQLNTLQKVILSLHNTLPSSELADISTNAEAINKSA